MKLEYEYPYELYIVDGKAIPLNTCRLEVGTNSESCRISYGVLPALPAGLSICRSTGTISGALVWEQLSEEEQEKTIKATPMAFQVIAKNPIGRTKAVVRMLLLRPPQDLVLRHSQVTYQVAQSKIAFSKELLEAAAAKGWRPLDFGPIDLARTEESNGPEPTFDAGSRFVWAASAEAPTVAGVAADIAGRWPLFSVTPELPKGLSLNRITGEIEGAAEDEVEGEWTVTACNPGGEAKLLLHMRVMAPPSQVR